MLHFGMFINCVKSIVSHKSFEIYLATLLLILGTLIVFFYNGIYDKKGSTSEIKIRKMP